ncbi:dnaJ homolog subfamily A member 1 homolog [Phoenix dactylifera]|uniref:DnaJ homolog subfamily A member 1 homolog n=1 Tax=Phoenix dactylifera TaxID=42345 RepID=A0A8B9A5F9_PHODC|nr:dnaJ homolog subfamily A member 1 homolog [Phoenix dactylifera]
MGKEIGGCVHGWGGNLLLGFKILADHVEAKFKQISKAYDVLSDMQKRAIYNYMGGEVSIDLATLLCNLEDLYKGTTKKIKISRDVMDSNG